MFSKLIPKLCPYYYESSMVQNYEFDFWVIGCRSNRCINAFDYSKDKYANRMDAIEGWNVKVREQENRLRLKGKYE